ncbi:hypothetical protein P4T20_02585 [Aneurinibacillus thermoaerophilus]|nr:hypothetical protein [Aneurinibacillus thermoaerophilus]
MLNTVDEYGMHNRERLFKRLLFLFFKAGAVGVTNDYTICVKFDV